jgi:hypothetical protein
MGGAAKKENKKREAIQKAANANGSATQTYI